MAWIHLTQNCQVVGLEGNVLTLGFANAGARDSFESSGCPEVVHQAAIDVVGADWKIETIVDPGAQPEGTPTVTKAATDAPARRRPAAARAARPTPEPETPEAASRRAADEAAADPAPDPSAAKPPPARRSSRPGPRVPRRRGPTTWPRRRGGQPRRPRRGPDDLGGEDLLARELGASMIEEIKHS